MAAPFGEWTLTNVHWLGRGQFDLGQEEFIRLGLGDGRVRLVRVPEDQVKLAALPAFPPTAHDLCREQAVAIRLELVAVEHGL